MSSIRGGKGFSALRPFFSKNDCHRFRSAEGQALLAPHHAAAVLMAACILLARTVGLEPHVRGASLSAKSMHLTKLVSKLQSRVEADIPHKRRKDPALGGALR